MIKILLIVIILFLNSLSVFAYTHLEVPIELLDEIGSNRTLVFGVDSTATDTWDSVLGELNAPRFPPPGNTFHASFEIYDSVRTMDLAWSYKDFRPIINLQHYYVQYSVKVYRGDGDLLIFTWNTMPLNIDSAKVTDKEEDLVLVDFNLTGTKRSDTVKNRYINDFYIKVWYNNPLADVVNEIDNDNYEFSVFPVPANGDKIYIKSKSVGFTYRVFTETGIELINGRTETDKTELIISDLTKGIYFIVLNTVNGQFVKKLVKL